MKSSFFRILAISKKEIKQILRDKKLLYIIFVFPILLLLLFGYAVNFDVHHIKLAVYDSDRSELSRNFIRSMTSTGYFDLASNIDSEKMVKKVLDEKLVQCVLVIPGDFSRDVYSGKNARLQFLIDGVDGNAANIISSYVNSATLNYSNKIQYDFLTKSGVKVSPPLEIKPRIWFNPDMSSTRYLVPGLMGMILIITAVVSVALSIVREKERGTVEQINVSPIKSLEFILGKTIPYSLISFIVSLLILFSGVLFFGVELKGSFLLLCFSIFLFILASINLGLYISAISGSQQVAFQLASLISLLPSMLLSGFVFPIDGQPLIIQILSNLTPAKFFLVIVRSILLKGVGFWAIYDQMIYLLIFATFFGLLSTILNKKLQAS